VRSIPAVYAFKDGQPVDGFMGAQPDTALKEFIDRLTGETDPKDFAGALALDEENAAARAGLARLYIDGGNEEGALQLLQDAPESVLDDPEITALKSKFDLRPAADEEDPTAELAAAVEAKPDDLDARLELAKALVGTGRNAEAVDHLIYSIGKNREYLG